MHLAAWPLALLLCASAARAAGPLQLEPLQTLCRGGKFSIHILDLNEFAEQQGYETCLAEENVFVDPRNGIVYDSTGALSSKTLGLDDVSAHHSYGTHSAPWHLAEALRKAGCHTDDINVADAVYDYCFYTTWLGMAHAMPDATELTRQQMDTPGDALLKGYAALQELPRWRRYQGQDFIFYDPHPGFVEGRSAWDWRMIWCKTLRNTIQLVVDRAAREYCERWQDMPAVLPTPYVPNVLDIAHAAATYSRTLPSVADRTTLVYSTARCAYTEHYMGVEFRLAVVRALEGKAPDIDVRCTNKELGGVHEPFGTMLSNMEHSQFCLALPGDSPSSRRLSEIFLAGCIPVIVGPPFHAMPLASVVDYSSTGVVFNITGPTPWIPQGQTQNLEIPDAALASLAHTSLFVIQVPDIASIEGHLRHMPQQEKLAKLARMAKLRNLMTFSDVPEGTLDAPAAILAMVKGVVTELAASQPVRKKRSTSMAKHGDRPGGRLALARARREELQLQLVQQ